MTRQALHRRTPRRREPPFLIGPRLFLRALNEADCRGPYPAWFNDAEVCRHNSHHVVPYERQDALAYVRRVKHSPTDLVLAIVLKATHRHIGNIALQQIDFVHRCAELAIVIGEKNCWGRSYAKEAAQLLLDHAFGALNLHRVSCGTSHNHLAMQRLAQSLGMRLEGRRRQALFKRHRYLDMLEYGVLRSEYLRRQRSNL